MPKNYEIGGCMNMEKVLKTASQYNAKLQEPGLKDQQELAHRRDIDKKEKNLRSLDDTVDKVKIIEKGITEEGIRKLLEEFGIADADEVIMFSGGAANQEGFSDEDFIKNIKDMLVSKIKEGAKGKDADDPYKLVIVTGGTREGFMEQVAQAVVEAREELKLDVKDNGINAKIYALGVAPESMVSTETFEDWENDVAYYKPAQGLNGLLLVDVDRNIGKGEKFGVETGIIELIMKLIGNDEVVKSAFMNNGGAGTVAEAEFLLRLGIPIEIIENSGRWSNIAEIFIKRKVFNVERILERLGEIRENQNSEILIDEGNNQWVIAIKEVLDKTKEWKNVLKLIFPGQAIMVKEKEYRVDITNDGKTAETEKNLLLAIYKFQQYFEAGLIKLNTSLRKKRPRISLYIPGLVHRFLGHDTADDLI